MEDDFTTTVFIKDQIEQGNDTNTTNDGCLEQHEHRENDFTYQSTSNLVFNVVELQFVRSRVRLGVVVHVYC